MVMMVRMFFALGGTRVADTGACHADFSCQWTTAAHNTNGGRAGVGAIPVKPDTGSKHCYILLVKACV